MPCPLRHAASNRILLNFHKLPFHHTRALPCPRPMIVCTSARQYRPGQTPSGCWLCISWCDSQHMLPLLQLYDRSADHGRLRHSHMHMPRALAMQLLAPVGRPVPEGAAARCRHTVFQHTGRPGRPPQLATACRATILQRKLRWGRALPLGSSVCVRARIFICLFVCLFLGLCKIYLPC